MSHSIIITLVKFTAAKDGVETFGFIASDGEGTQLWEDWPTEASFYMQFETEAALTEYVQSQHDAWTGWTGHVYVEGFNP